MSASPSAGGTVSGGGTFASGSSCTVTATAKSGYTFANWTENGSVVSSSASYPFTVNGNRTLVGNFTANPVNYTIAVTASPSGCGSVTKSPNKSSYSYNESVQLTATASSGYTFSHWSGDASGSSNPTNVTMNANKSVTANFTSTAPLYSGGSGTEADPYQIGTADDWHALASRSGDWSKYFILIRDLNLGGETIVPIGSQDTPFTGVFYGNGHIIRNAVINRPGSNWAGLFGFVDSAGQISYLGMEDGEMTGREGVGGIAGLNFGTITACYSAATVNGYQRVGALVGSDGGLCVDCYTVGRVTGGTLVGGLIGLSTGIINGCYSGSMVSGDAEVGGLVGRNGGTISASFWDTQLSGQVASAGGTGKTTAEMIDLSTFTDAGWSFNDVWRMPAEDYPYLAWQSTNAVYRFWSPKNGHHFYTIRAQEKGKLIANYPSSVWTYEQVAYHAFATDAEPGVADPVYRFWSPKNATHFYTIKEGEKNKLIAQYPPSVWTYEGVAFYAYAPGKQPTGTKAVYRFWSPKNGTHFYTMSEGEKNKLITQYATSVWTYEMVAWYAYE